MADSITIDSSKCTNCGLCTEVCFLGSFEQQNGKVNVAADTSACINCGHCIAACPVQAITNTNLDTDGFEFIEESACTNNEQLLALLKIRRSRREFKADRVPREIIDKLITAAIYAPSACNKQNISYTVIDDPSILNQLSNRCVAGAAQFARILQHPIGKHIAHLYLRSAYQDMVSIVPMIEIISKAHQSGVDLILHGAPCAILLHAHKNDTLAHADAIYCSSNIMLAAETLGLGTCLIGFVTDPSKRDPEIKRIAHIPPDHDIHSTIVVGYPKFKYLRSVAKLEPKVEYYGE